MDKDSVQNLLLADIFRLLSPASERVKAIEEEKVVVLVYHRSDGDAGPDHERSTSPL